MKTVKRILMVICFIPAVYLTGIQGLFYIVRWVFTGKPASDYFAHEQLMEWGDTL